MSNGTEATYCPEDNKLRLYCGRVPREEYLELRSLGFKSTPKQDCDFVATWSVRAEDKVLSMLDDGDAIGDEDQSPADRAADRAERFAGYLAKRTDEALGHADTYESGSSVHGFQSQARADRAASKHDRQRVKAYSQWDKAEYWQTRTAGVIDNALYLTSASVRRGRIVRLETELRRYAQPGGRWHTHLLRRLEYERAMLESQGGSATDVEIVPGGYFGGYMVLKVNKSPVTKQPVSCLLYRNGSGSTVNIQRYAENAYTPPTPADLETLAETLATIKGNRSASPKLINPTIEDAQRLQDSLNKLAKVRAANSCGTATIVEVGQMTQAEYSYKSKRSDCWRTEYLRADGTICPSKNNYRNTPAPENLCRVRTGPAGWINSQIIVITDKPQKPLPAWSSQVEAVTA